MRGPASVALEGRAKNLKGGCQGKDVVRCANFMLQAGYSRVNEGADSAFRSTAGNHLSSIRTFNSEPHLEEVSVSDSVKQP